MKDLHADKRALNTAMQAASRYVNNCEGAEMFVIKNDDKYKCVKKTDKYLFKVEFKGGKLNVVDPKKEERKAKKAAKKVLPELPGNTNDEPA